MNGIWNRLDGIRKWIKSVVLHFLRSKDKVGYPQGFTILYYKGCTMDLETETIIISVWFSLTYRLSCDT